MAKRQPPFRVVYDDEVEEHLDLIDAKYHSLIRATIESQLQHEPTRATRNRKPLQRPLPFQADWALRFGPDNRFRAFYAVDVERHEVQVLAIGMKEGNRLMIRGEEVES
jgi:hypothetical protein